MPNRMQDGALSIYISMCRPANIYRYHTICVEVICNNIKIVNKVDMSRLK